MRRKLRCQIDNNSINNPNPEHHAEIRDNEDLRKKNMQGDRFYRDAPRGYNGIHENTQIYFRPNGQRFCNWATKSSLQFDKLTN